MSEFEVMFSDVDVEGWIYSPQIDCWVHPDGAPILLEALIEQSDPRFFSKHGTRHCRNQGCDGPMCAKAARDHTRTVRPPAQIRVHVRHKYGKLDALLERVQEYYEVDWVPTRNGVPVKMSA